MGSSALKCLFAPLVDRWDGQRVFVTTQAVQAVLVPSVPLAAARTFSRSGWSWR